LGVYSGVSIRTDTIRITPEILGLIAEIDEFKGAWRALGTIAPERLSALRRVATIESIGSSTRIEGSRLTDREIERLLSNLEIKSFASRDEQEVAGCAAATGGQIASERKRACGSEILRNGGGSGIRTHVTLSRKHAFQACALSHSAIPPRRSRSARRTAHVVRNAGVRIAPAAAGAL
jgi:hypothetical protein